MENYYDALWAMFMTETTVGYGEIFPATHPGRFWAGFAAFIAPWLFAGIVFVLFKSLLFRREEFLAYSWIYKT